MAVDYEVCRGCYAQTSGVHSWNGEIYCEDCFAALPAADHASAPADNEHTDQPPSREAADPPLWALISVRHESRTIPFRGCLLSSARHPGLNPLVADQGSRPGVSTLVEIFKREGGDYVIAAGAFDGNYRRIASIAFKLDFRRLATFLSKQCRTSPAEQVGAWQRLASDVASSALAR